RTGGAPGLDRPGRGALPLRARRDRGHEDRARAAPTARAAALTSPCVNPAQHRGKLTYPTGCAVETSARFASPVDEVANAPGARQDFRPGAAVARAGGRCGGIPGDLSSRSAGR